MRSWNAARLHATAGQKVSVGMKATPSAMHIEIQDARVSMQIALVKILGSIGSTIMVVNYSNKK